MNKNNNKKLKVELSKIYFAIYFYLFDYDKTKNINICDMIVFKRRACDFVISDHRQRRIYISLFMVHL